MWFIYIYHILPSPFIFPPKSSVFYLGTDNLALTDNWDDPEGYYQFRLGDLLDGRYEVYAMQGKGVFSSVLRVRDKKQTTTADANLVVKVIRKNDIMYKAGLKGGF